MPLVKAPQNTRKCSQCQRHRPRCKSTQSRMPIIDEDAPISSEDLRDRPALPERLRETTTMADDPQKLDDTRRLLSEMMEFVPLNRPGNLFLQLFVGTMFEIHRQEATMLAGGWISYCRGGRHDWFTAYKKSAVEALEIALQQVSSRQITELETELARRMLDRYAELRKLREIQEKQSVGVDDGNKPGTSKTTQTNHNMTATTEAKENIRVYGVESQDPSKADTLCCVQEEGHKHKTASDKIGSMTAAANEVLFVSYNKKDSTVLSEEESYTAASMTESESDVLVVVDARKDCFSPLSPLLAGFRHCFGLKSPFGDE